MSDATRATVVAIARHDPRAGPRLADDLEAGVPLTELLEAALDPARHARQQSLLQTSRPDRAQAIATAAAELAAWQSDGITVTTVLDPAYPANLRGVHDRPPILFERGRRAPDPRAIAVIGSRRPSAQGLERAQRIAAHLVAHDFTVVSGLAAGIDTAAHTAALDHGGHTVAVIGTGLRHSYPPENVGLQRTIAARGAVLSPFWPDTPPSRETFPRRNVVMSGVSLASVIVEAGVTSGARIQARLALAHGRRVFLAAELLDQSWAQALATRPAVHVFAEPAEITDRMPGATGAVTP